MQQIRGSVGLQRDRPELPRWEGQGDGGGGGGGGEDRHARGQLNHFVVGRQQRRRRGRQRLLLRLQPLRDEAGQRVVRRQDTAPQRLQQRRRVCVFISCLVVGLAHSFLTAKQFLFSLTHFQAYFSIFEA